MKTSMVEIKIGDKVSELRTGRVGILKDIRLVPNSYYNGAELVAFLYVHMKDSDSIVSSTSDKWTMVEAHSYSEFYPSVRSSNLCNEIKDEEDPPSMTQSYFHD